MPVKATIEEDVGWVAEAIRSVRAQTYKDWEIRLVNDHSTVSLAPLKKLVVGSNDQIHASKTGKDGAGVAFARNLAASEAQGELLLPLDHDDILPPKAMQTMVEAWDSQGKDFGVVYGDVLSFGPDFQRHMPMPKFLFTTLLRTLIMPIGSLHAKSAWKEIGGWNDKFQGGLEDWAYWIEMAVNGYHGFHIPMVTYHYRRHSHGRLAALRTNEDKFGQQRALIHQHFQEYYDGKEPKMCKGCGSKILGRWSGRTARPSPAPTFQATTSVSSERVLVKYIGRRSGGFHVTGRATGWRYYVPGGYNCIVEGPDTKPGVHQSDVEYFRGYDGGRAFMVEPVQ